MAKEVKEIKSKRVQILTEAATQAGVPVGMAIKLGYALEQLNHQIVPTDETLEYYKLSKEDASSASGEFKPYR